MKILHPTKLKPNLIDPVLVSTGYLVVFLFASAFTALVRADPWMPIWYFPSGLSFALLLTAGMAYAPIIFAANLLAITWVSGFPLSISLMGLALLQTASYTLAAAILRRQVGSRLDLFTLRETTYFILAGIFTPLVLAACSVALLVISGYLSGPLFVSSFFKLWIEESLGNLAIAPLVIILFNWQANSDSRQNSWLLHPQKTLPYILVAGAQAACILAAFWIVFGLSAKDDHRLWYLFFLPLIWTILQFGIRGAAAAIPGISLGSILAVRFFHYPLLRVEDLQIFMLMLALTGLVCGAAFSELRTTQQRLQHRLEMEGRITAISTRFINLNLEYVDEAIRQAMQSVGAFCGADGSHLLLFSLNGDGRQITHAYEWAADPSFLRAAHLEGMSMTDLPYLMSKLEAGEYFYIPDLETLPSEAKAEREYMQKNNLRSMVTIPIMLGNRLAGSLGFHSTCHVRAWAEEDIRLFSLLGETFLNVLERQRAENLVRESDRKFRSVVLQSHDGIILVNERGQVIEWNSGMEKITGLKRNNVLGHVIWDTQIQLTAPEQRTPEAIQNLQKNIEAFLRDGTAGWLHQVYEVVLHRSDGQKRTMQTVTFPIQTARGYMMGTIARDVTELRQGEIALRRSQAHLEEAERLAHLGHFQIAVPGGQMEWSEETYRICEWDPANPVPDIQSVLEDIHPEDLQQVLDAVNSALSEHTSFDLEYRIMLRTGTIKYIHTIGRVVTGAGGAVTHIFGTMMDISERRSVLEALRESKTRYKELADSISDIFFALDNNLMITYWNRVSEALTGIPAEEAVGADIFRLLPTLKGTSVEQFLFKAFQTRQHQGFVMEHRVRGRKIYLEVNAYPFTNGLAVFLRNVTERQAAEERLRQSEARYRAVVEDQTDLICRFTPGGMVTFANEAYCRCFASPRRGLVGHHFVRYSAGPDHRDLSGQYTSLVHSRAVTYEYQTVLPDGKLHWLQWIDRPILDDEGKIIEYQSVGRDISDSKRLEDELRYLSTHDALTGIYNRSFFEAELARLQRGRSWPVSIVMVDVNGLKSTNDTRGHSAGDELLKRAANMLSACFRPEDIVARFGGDEFAVLLPSTDDDAAAEIIYRMRANLEAYNRSTGGVTLSLSIGVATGEKGQPLLDVLTCADTHMYQDKIRQKHTG